MAARKQSTIQFNYAALLGLMREKGYTQEMLADAANMGLTQLSHKLKGRYPFQQAAIHNISNVLSIAPVDIGRYFFTV